MRRAPGRRQLQFGGASTGITYSAQLGRYTKIGRMVIATGNIVLTSKGTSTGAAQIAGLPFTAANDGIYSSAAGGLATGMSSVVGAVLCCCAPNTQKLNCYHSNNGAGVGAHQRQFRRHEPDPLSPLCYDAA